jgi:hypothetical protein
VIARALAKDRGARFETGEAMAEAIGALQLRSREVAPLLRLFQQQTAQGVQMLAMLAILVPSVWQLQEFRGTLRGTVLLTLAIALAMTSVVQLLGRVRFVVRQGFTAADADTAFDAIREETDRGRELLLADPVERQRLRRRKVIAAVGGALSGTAIGFLPQYVFTTEAGERVFHPMGFWLLIAATALAGVSLGLWTMRPVRITLGQRVATRLWRSAIGRALFARAERRYAAELRRAGG